ncbi:hypothetical protein A2572_02280 [Candidatus Collierbacteria bacterium RIFOXYD1_FULL_40_9]|uniref:Uncharacterized protein n=1 Tax=Candidatus Collierbacteria bacterium RIFOXYD1_FULL_40_9 TaxID=1817731 RepID=A0A1F5FNW3_9BACT|nr:MAG: hypothetical protein A2572_02280 [Candidatus Collierbacteria bacterium RIFOXYD1_FULL_40_9]
MKELCEGKIKTAIFDMDGTIYELDGDNGGFKNSSLQKKVKENTAKLFSKKENISLKKTNKLIDELNEKGTFLSVYAEKYGLTRKDFFDIVWNIDPESIVTNYHESVEVITELANRNIELILLTQAPQVWQNNVFSFLNLQNMFGEVYTGETFMHKPEIFPKISASRRPNTVLAIGDQLETDILPASEQGFFTFHVQTPKDLLKLLKDD